MDWANERYVRVYTRDTINRKLLPWQARHLLDTLWRYFDRAGVIELGGHDPVRAIAALIDDPEDFVAVALPALVEGDDPPLRLYESGGKRFLVSDSFMDAQEAAQSDKSRAKASREKRKDLVRRRRVTSRDGSVTNCDAPVTNCDETVTPRHTASLQTKLAQTNPSQPSCAPGSPEWIKSELDKRDELALVATEKFAERLLGAAISAGTVELIPKALDEAAEKLGAKDAVDAAPAKEHQASFVLGCVKRVKSGPPPGAMSHAAVKGTEPRLPWDDGPSRTQQICNLEDRERQSQLSAEQNAQAAREALAKLGGLSDGSL